MVRRKRWLYLTAILFVLVLSVPVFLYLLDFFTGINAPYATQSTANSTYPELGGEWVMHPVDNPGDWLPNGLDAADVNGDGRLDYVTNYEFRGRVRVALYPDEAAEGTFWQAVDVGSFPNAESSALGDLDQDGWPDVVVAHGIEHTTETPGIAVLWHKGSEKPAWTAARDLPASQGGWQFLYIKTFDLDGDDDLDIIAGGRAARLAGSGKEIEDEEALVWAGIRWFANPASEGDDPRDLSAWTMHLLDPDTQSGHGFEFGDIDGDGDIDLANANADWDTPEAEENVVWYENPGKTSAFYDPWPIHELYRGDEFYGKEQLVIVDLDGDGLNDLLVHTEKAIYWFDNQSAGAEIRFERNIIAKHPAAQWRARPLEAADLNEDGRLDLIGALIHADGTLPRDKAALFWMEQGDDGDWTTHLIKWGDGFLGIGPFNGEKWDQMIPVDVDDDGDLDLMANVEEYNRLSTILAVVWFENPLRQRRRNC